MTTRDVVDDPSSELPPISSVVRALLGWHDETQTALAKVLGMSQQALSARINGQRPWSASDVAILARHFKIPAGTFYEGLQNLKEVILHVPLAATRQAA